MKTTNPITVVVLAITLLLGVGCATDSTDATDPTTMTDGDGAGFHLATEADLEGLNQSTEEFFVGCSNAQIRDAQAACRNTFCGSRGSNGIHSCDQNLQTRVVCAHCDCRTGEDPVICRSF